MEKRRYKAKLLSMAITVTMTASLFSGCGKGDTKTVVKMDKDHVYQVAYIEMPEGLNNVRQLSAANDLVYFDGYDETDNSTYKLYSVKSDGGDLKEIYKQNPKDNSNVLNYTVDTDGNLRLMVNESLYDDKDPENIINENKYYLLTLGSDGSELDKIQLKMKETDNFYPQSMLIDKSGNCISMSYQGIEIFDKKGGHLSSIDTSESQIDNMFMSEDGKIMLASYSREFNGKEIKELLVEENKFSEPKKLTGDSYSTSFYRGIGYDLLMKDSTNLYGYDLETEEKVKLLNWIDSDINSNFLSSIAPLSDGRMVCLTENFMKNTRELAVLTKMKPEDVVDKTILSLACLNLDLQTNSAVIEFNKKSDKYRINVKIYSAGDYNTDDNYLAAQTKMNTDIMSGDIPDILAVSDMTSFNSLCSKGMFVDYNEFMKKDSEFKRSDYLENILQAISKDEKLYVMAPYFNIFTIVGKSSNVGPTPGWTMDDLDALIASKPKDTQVFANMTKQRILAYANNISLENYVNLNEGTCNFDNPEFVRLLELANTFMDEDKMQDDMSMSVGGSASSSSDGKIVYDISDDELAYRKDKILLEDFRIAGFSDFHRAQKVRYGEEITFIGFPTSEKNGSAFSPGLQLAISSKSQEKDAAWEFLKTFLGDDFQDNLDYGWPIKLSSLEKKKEKERKPQTYKDEKGKEQEYKEMYMLDGKEVELGTITDEECQKVIDFIKSLNKVVINDQKIMEIMNEETGAYFAGQKSAKDTAKLIQNRVQTYLNEMK